MREEIEAVQNYLNIEKIRYEEKLEIHFDIQEAVLDVQLPSFLIHPLVENAVKYGMRSSTLPLQLQINAKADNRDLVLVVANSGTWAPKEQNPFAKETFTGIGLKNIRQRLDAYFPNHNQFETIEVDQTVEARLRIGDVL